MGCLWAGPVEGDAPEVETQETLYKQMTGGGTSSAPAVHLTGMADSMPAAQRLKDNDLLLAGLDGNVASTVAGKAAAANATGGAGSSRSARAGWLLLGLVAAGFVLAGLALTLGRRSDSR